MQSTKASWIVALLVVASISKAEEVVVPDPVSDHRYDDELVQWLPHSVTVITKEELEATYNADLEAIESIAPGLLIDRMNTTPRGAAISIRGLGSAGGSKALDPAVAVNIDGVYVGTHTGRMQVLFDFEKVEVARGPQGTQIGAPNLSGAVSITRTKPTGEFDADVRMTMGDDDRREINTVVNFPLNEDLSGKLAIYWKDRGGDYVKNVFNSRNENTEDYILTTGTIAWDYEDLFDLQYTFDLEVSDETTPALLNVSQPNDLLCVSTGYCGSGKNPQFGGIHLTSQNFSNERDFDGEYHTIRVDFTFAGHEVTSITGIRSSEETMDMDIDASHADFYHLMQDQKYDQASHEFRVRRQYSDDLGYTVGLYFLNSDYELFQQEHHILKQLGDAGFSEGHAAGEIQELSSEQESNLQSIFAEVEYVLNDQWIADAALRWTRVDRDFEHSPSRIRLGDTLSPLRTLLVGEEDTSEMLASVGFSYKVDEEAMIYMRYAEGFLPGGFDENAMSAFTGNSYGAETTRAAEVGLKSDWWDDQLRVNVAFYKTELDNKVERFNTFNPDGEIESILDNVAEVELSGWEVEIESTPFENLYIKTVYSHINPDYNKYSVTDLANPAFPINNDNLLPARAPRENLYFSLRYSHAYGPGTIHTYAGYRLFGDYQTNPEIPIAKVGNWQAWDLSVSYEYKEWLFRLFSNNVKDKRYIQNVTDIMQTHILPVGAGATQVPSLATFAEYNQPRFTGLEIIYRPDL